MSVREVPDRNYLKEAGLLPPRQCSSEVWRYFGFRGENGKIEDPKHVVCTINKCGAVLKYCGNTTNLAAHMKSRHPLVFMKTSLSRDSNPAKQKEKRAQEDQAVSMSSTVGEKAAFVSPFQLAAKLPTSSKRASVITDAVAYFIAKDMQPVSAVECLGFRSMFKVLEPRYEIPSRKTFTQRVLPALYVKVKESVATVVSLAEWYAITTDCWTSCANNSFIGVTFHTISNDWQLQHLVLENVELPDKHTAENLAASLEDILKQWELDSTKLSGATVDNAANIQKAVADILKWKCLGCFGHTINLCVKAGLKQQQIQVALARCSRLVKFFRKSTVAANLLTKKQAALESPVHKLVKDVETRWNSTYDMVQRIIEQQGPVCATLVELKRLDLLPKEEDFTLLEQLVNVLKPFRDVTIQVQGEQYVTISIIRPLLHHLTENVLQLQETDSSVIKNMKRNMVSNLGSRYQSLSISNLLDCACFLDPRFKSLPFMSEDNRKKLHTFVLEEAIDHYESLNSDTEPAASEEKNEDQLPLPKKHKSELGQLLGDMFTNLSQAKQVTSRDKAENVLQKYLDEPCLNIDENALKWWEQNSSRFPAISKIAQRLLCIPATSTPAERLFSTAGNIISSKRANLDPDNASMLCFLAENLQ
ncbi:E3 SUMO-protein ligase ZBED1-like [Corticium candelabrum]|uniref:E3 SUMO-protein ligase ZBED1-like n=1 Tax=Corticium candelabrum TaxID=121492 RepID=UPI002E26B83C|nr:E3 SUMO-protein ligase ZBED1-like [Corticium candelabrum]